MESQNTPLPDLVIFDLDGVLVDSSRCHEIAYGRLWELCEVMAPDYSTIAGRRTVQVVEEYTVALSPSREQIEWWVNFKQSEARRLQANELSVFEDAVPVLRALYRHGRTLAIATGASQESAGLALSRLGFEEIFDAVVTGDDVENGKPNPEVILEIVHRTGIPVDRSLVIEDSIAGLFAALTAGAKAACVRTGLTVDHPHFVGSFSDLRSWMAGMRIDIS